MVVGVAFGLVVLALIGSEAAGSYWAGFLMEKALSLDNVFVIAVLLSTFAVPQALKADVLTFGIARRADAADGVHRRRRDAAGDLPPGDLRDGRAAGLHRHPAGDLSSDSRRRLRRRAGTMRLVARAATVSTPLLAALLAVALADVIFAIDSIPAVLAITQDTFLIFAANAFALLGLRALYFLLDGMAQKFEYLHYGLGALLVFVGVKMLVEDIVGHLPVGVSLGVIVATLGAVGRRLAAVLVEERHGGGVTAGERAQRRSAPRASPARRSRSRSAAASSGLGSHWAMSGRSSGVSSPKSLRKSGVVR